MDNTTEIEKYERIIANNPSDSPIAKIAQEKLTVIRSVLGF